jgi:dephospho-CoA kinase
VTGISGGIAGGKTTVAELLAQKLNADLISADAITHELLQHDSELKQKIVSRWGAACLAETGGISRKKLGEIVFNSSQQLEELNRIIHPRILAEIQNRIGRSTTAYIVLDAALLFETGLHEVCDVTVFVESNWRDRVRRARQSRGWTEQELERRQAAQMPLSQKRNSSDHIVNNCGSLYETEQQIERISSKIHQEQQS